MSEMVYIKPEIAHAVALAPKLRLDNVQCIGLSAKILDPVALGNANVLDYELHKVPIMWHLAKDALSVAIRFGLSVVAAPREAASSTDTDDQRHVAELVVAMRIDYSLRAEVDDDVLRAIPHCVAINGYIHAWPYFRADVQYLTTKIGFPALVLPVVLSGEVPDRVMVAATPDSPNSEEIAHKPRKSSRTRTSKRKKNISSS